jgi:hypothetical protein
LDGTQNTIAKTSSAPAPSEQAGGSVATTVIGRDAASQMAGPAMSFCERCGNLVGHMARLRGIGMRRCPSCGMHACDRCWMRAADRCPGCGVSADAPIAKSAPVVVSQAAAVSVAAAPRTAAERWQATVAAAAPVSAPVIEPQAAIAPPTRPMTTREPTILTAVATLSGTPAAAAAERRGDPSRGRQPRSRRVPIVIAGAVSLVVALSAFAILFGDRGRPPARSGLALGAPAGATSAAPRQDESPSSSATSAAVPVASAVPSAPNPPRGTAPPAPTPPLTAEPTPTPPATPAPTPHPTPGPTPHPTPVPTPHPTACVLAAPQLVGERRNDAAGLWESAGFTGAVTALPGNGNYVIASQDLLAGQTYPCDSSVTVGPPPPPKPT